jgi:hypothetical protein
LAAVFAWGLPARADYVLGLDPHPDVLTVTDATPEGRALPPVSPEHPVYYVAEDLGFRVFGGPMSGDTLPPHKAIVSVIVKTLQKEGFLPADKAHRPTQFIIFSWGTMYQPGYGSIQRKLLQFMGADKVGLSWLSDPHFGNTMVEQWKLTQGFLTPTAQKIYDNADSHNEKVGLYVVKLGGFDFQALVKGNPIELWETRISCSADGLALADTLPVMITAAGPQIGRETPIPVWRDTAEDLEPHVEIGQQKVVEYIDPDKAPVIDASNVARKSAAATP